MSSVPQIFAGLCLLLILTSCVGVEPHRDFDRPTASASSASSSTRSGSIFTNTSRRGTASLKAGLGFTLDPDTFLMGIEGSYHVHPNFSVGPLLQAGVSGKRTLIAPTLNVHGIMDLPPHAFSRLKPYLQGGIGMAYLEENNRPGDNDDEGFLFNLGGERTTTSRTESRSAPTSCSTSCPTRRSTRISSSPGRWRRRVFTSERELFAPT